MKNIRDIRGKLEPFIDNWLISEIQGIGLKLHNPQPEEVVMEFNKPWEGSTSAYITIFKDKDVFRMYYRGSNYNIDTKVAYNQFTCYAESSDGIHWTKPEMNLCEFNGSKRNNIIRVGTGVHNFTPFLDVNHDIKDNERYKALGSDEGGLFAFVSGDGITWRLFKNKPIITKGAFDSQNLAFYDSVNKRYLEYHRGWSQGGFNGIRDIMVCVSNDFDNWSEPEFLIYEDLPQEHLYTNAIKPYFRAPHIYCGFPKRFVPERNKTKHPVDGVSDGLFMTSRDGLHWKRWQEAFIRPGIQPERWVNRNNMTAWGIITTKSRLNPDVDEISLYSSEGYYTEKNRLRRYTIRTDGFVSINASAKGGYFITRPLVFSGENLVINYSTSAAGKVLVGIMDENKRYISGFSVEDCIETYGDSIEETINWKSGSDLSKLKGNPVRLHFLMYDADLYSICFKDKV